MKKIIINIFLIMTVLIFLFLHWAFIAKKFECNNVDCYEGTPQLEDDVDYTRVS
jgi:hypothetical protein